MAGFGAKVKLTVDRSSKAEFNKQINDMVGQIKIPVVGAVNHDLAAIRMHQTNHPFTEHYKVFNAPNFSISAVIVLRSPVPESIILFTFKVIGLLFSMACGFEQRECD